MQTGEVRVVELFGVLDCGLVVNPRLVERQVTGMLIQATSRMLYEEVQFNDRHVTSLDWGTYPVLRFDQVPKVHAILVNRPQEPSTGAGEEVMAAAAGAIANAVSAALGGVHLGRFPLVAERVKSAGEASASVT
ncbi:Nicotinate dehydrogenase subunit B [compost metagenome]